MKNPTPFLLSAILLAAAGRGATADWDVGQAPLRLTVKISDPPVPLAAGTLVHVPDGGLLPRPAPAFTAVAADGKRLTCCVLWHDPDRGAVLLFEHPATGDTVRLYARQSSRPQVWSPSSGLTPGTFAVVRTGEVNGTMMKRMPHPTPPGKGTIFTRLPEPALGGHPKAKPGPFSAHVWGHLLCNDPGSVWVAPLGPVETVIDGFALQKGQQSEKSGGTGASVLMSKGTHRFELFHHSTGTRGDAMRLAWRLPNTPEKELAPGPDGVPDWFARPVRAAECTRSGAAKLVDVEFRDARPTAAFTARPLRYFHFAQHPVVQYELEAFSSKQAADVAYRWTLPDGSGVSGSPRVTWIVEATGDQTVALSASRGGAASQCRRTFDTAVPGARRARITSADDRRTFRDTFLAMLRSQPGGRAQLESWTPSMWDLLVRLSAPGEGEELLKAVLVDHPETTAAAMIPGHLEKLEGLYFTAACPTNPDSVLSWIDKQLAGERSAARIAMWHLRRAEVRMFYLDKRDAEIQADLAAARRGGGDITMWGRIREGDFALLRGDAETALTIYGRIQDDVRHSDVVAPANAGERRTRAPSREELRSRWRRGRREAAHTEATGQEIEDWRIGVIRDTATSETARHLIKHGHHEDAMALLAKWEMEFPLSKLTGDYFVVEAMLRIALGDAKRADTILQAYCSAVDMTNYLPEAMKLRLMAMKQLGADKETLGRFVDDMKRRFPDHPIVSQAESLL